MDRFDALPTPQKVLIAFLAMAATAGLFYFLLISDVEARIGSAEQSVRQAQTKKAQLEKFGTGELQRALQAEEADLEEQLADNKALLPQEDKIPALITSIKRQADERGLKIEMFKKQERIPDDYVDIVPVAMEVTGTFPVVVSFFEALAQPGMRMMTVDGLELTAVSMNEQMREGPGRSYGGAGSPPPDWRTGRTRAGDDRNLSPAEKFLRKIELYERTADRMKVNASFTVNAYSYTGDLLTAEQREQIRRRRGRAPRRR